MRLSVVVVVAKNLRFVDKEKGKVTKADKGTDDHLNKRREQHVKFSIEQREMIMSKITVLVRAYN
jgi:hypothetical protein